MDGEPRGTESGAALESMERCGWRWNKMPGQPGNKKSRVNMVQFKKSSPGARRIVTRRYRSGGI